MTQFRNTAALELLFDSCPVQGSELVHETLPSEMTRKLGSFLVEGEWDIEL